MSDGKDLQTILSITELETEIKENRTKLSEKERLDKGSSLNDENNKCNNTESDKDNNTQKSNFNLKLKPTILHKKSNTFNSNSTLVNSRQQFKKPPMLSLQKNFVNNNK